MDARVKPAHDAQSDQPSNTASSPGSPASSLPGLDWKSAHIVIAGLDRKSATSSLPGSTGKAPHRHCRA
jgi:hypothetical protein